MPTTTFSSVIEEKLRLLEIPEIVQEVVLFELTEIIIKRVYTDLISMLSPEDALHAEKLLAEENYLGLQDLLMSYDGAEKVALSGAEEIIEEFARELRSEA